MDRSLPHLWLALLLTLGIAAFRFLGSRPARSVAKLIERTRRPPHSTGAALVALALIGIAISRPQWGTEAAPAFRANGTVWLCLDVSRSMRARDVPGNRLEQGKRLLLDLLETLEDRPVGVIAFAGDARIISPPTYDRPFVRQAIADLSTESAPPGGSDWTTALRTIADLAPTGPAADIALLVTDGGHQPRPIEPVAERARERGIVVFTIGVGNPEVASPIPLPGGDGLLREGGTRIETRLIEEPIRELAESTGGFYIPARTRDADLADIFDRQLEPRAKLLQAERTVPVPVERFQLFLIPALLLALLGDRLLQVRGER